jgi:LacI family transcriptional regulator
MRRIAMIAQNPDTNDRAAELLIAQLSGEAHAKSIECAATLIVRESCAPPHAD